MAFISTDWTRKTYQVKAVKVTADNMEDVAKWTRGTIGNTRDIEGYPKRKPNLDFIEVPVETRARQQKSKAYVGDWVTKNEKAFAVYGDAAFKTVFLPASQETLSDVSGMVLQAMKRQADDARHGYPRHAETIAIETARSIVGMGVSNEKKREQLWKLVTEAMIKQAEDDWMFDRNQVARETVDKILKLV